MARIKALEDAFMARKGYEFSTLWWNLQRVSGCTENNTVALA
ncbi:hypothetical protein [Variovorax rhizosphaerae]|uniref:Uncharacterized protein n=1 Tax=Variovorax rhizosphaerae TaxID=1836200 RepID=A0ABU8WZJ2_9BURK